MKRSLMAVEKNKVTLCLLWGIHSISSCQQHIWMKTASLSSPIPTLFSWIMGVLWSSALVFRCSCYYQDDETWQNKQLGVSFHCFLARTTRYLVSKYCYEFIATWGCGSMLHRKTWTKFLLLVTILSLS